MKQAHVLVTGGAGFIGSHVVARLLAEDRAVVVLDDFNDYYNPAIKRQNLAPLAQHPNLSIVEGDLTDKATLEALFAQYPIDRIVHLAARAGVRPSLLQPELYMNTNVMGTFLLAQQAVAHGVEHMVFASSSSVYGAVQAEAGQAVQAFCESQDTSRPISPYAATKMMGENLLHTYSHLHGLTVVCLRFFTVYGPGQRPDLAIHKFSSLIDRGLPIPVYGDGSTRRDYTYITDILQGIWGAMAYQQERFSVFNLGESQTTPLLELIRALEAGLGKTAVLDWQPLQPGDVPITYANISRARQHLGYAPSTPLSEGLPLFLDWYQQQQKVCSL